MNNVLQGPRLISVNRLKLTPEFRCDSKFKVRWLEDYDESCLDYETILKELTKYGPRSYGYTLREICCLVSETFLEENGLALGGTFLLSYASDQEKAKMRGPSQNKFHIVGVYESSGDGQCIYAELGQYLYNQYFLADETSVNGQKTTPDKITWQSAAFTIPASRLTDMRDTLEELEYSKIGDLSSQRRWVVLDDRTFLDTQQAMNQRLRYMEILFPVVYAMTELLALAASYILTMNHKKDLAVMRSQGASRGTGFWSLFLNQLLLCVLGAGIGYGILAATHTWTMLIGIFMVLWLLGSSISIARMNRREIVRMMKSAE